MEESIVCGGKEEDRKAGEGFSFLLEDAFHLKKRDFSQYSPLTLAYVGDAVYELVIRTVLAKRGNTQTAKLHQKATNLVRAGAQAKLIQALLPRLEEAELAVYRRGHNAKPYNTAKNASRREYLEATGFEALMGYLYLREEYQRMIDLISLGLEESGYEL